MFRISRKMLRAGAVASAAGVVAMLAGCAGDAGSGSGNGPGVKLASNQCGNIRGELNRLDSRGVPNLIEARSSGKKMSTQQDADISRYNSLLEQYLRGQCQV